MHAKQFMIGALAGALTLFAWESVSNTLIPWHAPTMSAFADSNAVVQTIKANAPENGMYVDARGVVAAVSFLPDLGSRESLLGLMLGRQFLIDVVVSVLVLLAFVRLPRVGTRQYALAAGSIALAVSASAFVSDWNWYGFGVGWALVNTVDRAIGYTLMGLVLGALINKWSHRSKTDEWVGVKSHGGLPAARASAPEIRR